MQKSYGILTCHASADNNDCALWWLIAGTILLDRHARCDTKVDVPSLSQKAPSSNCIWSMSIPNCSYCFLLRQVPGMFSEHVGDRGQAQHSCSKQAYVPGYIFTPLGRHNVAHLVNARPLSAGKQPSDLREKLQWWYARVFASGQEVTEGCSQLW